MRYNPNDNPLIRRLEALEGLLRGNSLESASFGRGGIRVYGGGSIRIQGGGSLYIEGGGGVSVTGSGFIRGDGEFDWAGTFRTTGSAVFDGDVEITKTLDVRATTRLRGATDLETGMTVKSGGSITVEGTNPIRLRHVSGLPAIEVGSAGQIIGAEDGVSVLGGSSYMSLLDSGALVSGPGGSRVELKSNESLFENGTKGLRITPTTIQFRDLPTRPRASANNAVIGTLFVNPDGFLSRVIA